MCYGHCVAENSAFFIRLGEGSARDRVQKVTLQDGTTAVAVIVTDRDLVESVDARTTTAVDRVVEPTRGY